MTLPHATHPMSDQDVQSYRFRDEEASFGSLSTARGHLPLRALDLHGRIVGLTYSLRLRQTFRNPGYDSLEATYIFPLPARAAVTGFRMRTRDREVIGELQDRATARETYDTAIQQGFQAAIAEEERPEVFTMRVGNIPACEDIQIELDLSGPLALADDMATFRFPLVVAPRYMPGMALGGPNVGDGVAHDTDATPDASRISPPVLLPGYPNPVRLGLTIELDSLGLDFGAIYTSLQELYLDGNQLMLAPGTGRLDRDLILRFPVLREAVQTTLAQVADPEGGAYTWALTVVPPAAQAAAAVAPRTLMVLLDRSGSMEGWKMAAARRAVARIVDSFRDQDRFALLAFDTVIEEVASPSPGTARSLFQPATDRNRFRATQDLAKIEARGGTELTAALTAGLERLQQSRAPGDRFLVLVTDGQVGNEDQTLREVQRLAGGARDLVPDSRGEREGGLPPSAVRIFTVGIDRAVNASLLERLGTSTGGHFELVESEDRLDEVMLQLQRRICQPLVTDLQIETASEERSPLTADLFPGLPARQYGRTRRPLPDQVRVTGRQADGQTWSCMVSVQTSSDETLRSLWARERLLELEHGFVTGKPGAACTPAAITEFSLAFGVLCRFTSFVAVDRSRVVSPGGPRRQVVQAVESPSGWEMQKQVQMLREGPPLQSNWLGCAAPVSESWGGPPPAPRPRAGAPPVAPLKRKAAPCKAEIAHPAVNQPVRADEAPTDDQLLEQLQEIRKGLAAGSPVAELLSRLMDALRVRISAELLQQGSELLAEARAGRAVPQLRDWLNQVEAQLAPPPAKRKKEWWKIR